MMETSYDRCPRLRPCLPHPPTVYDFFPSLEAAAAKQEEANAYNVKLEAHGAPKRNYVPMHYDEYKAKERELYLSRRKNKSLKPNSSKCSASCHRTNGKAKATLNRFSCQSTGAGLTHSNMCAGATEKTRSIGRSLSID